MESTEGMKLVFTRHAREQLTKKWENLGIVRAEEAFSNPKSVYPNKKYEGQFRVVGNGLCLVGKPSRDVFLVFTVYEDGVMTAPRPDQLNTPEGQEYAKIYKRERARREGTGGPVKRNNEYWPRVHSRKRETNHTETN